MLSYGQYSETIISPLHKFLFLSACLQLGVCLSYYYVIVGRFCVLWFIYFRYGKNYKKNQQFTVIILGSDFTHRYHLFLSSEAIVSVCAHVYMHEVTCIPLLLVLCVCVSSVDWTTRWRMCECDSLPSRSECSHSGNQWAVTVNHHPLDTVTCHCIAFVNHNTACYWLAQHS